MMIYSQPRRHPHDFLCRQLVLLTRELLVTVTADSHVYTYVWLSCAAAWDDDSPNAPFFIVSATLVISMDLRYRTPKHDTQENAISSLPPPPPPCRLGNWAAARLIRLIILFEFESRHSDLYCSRSPTRLIYSICCEIQVVQSRIGERAINNNFDERLRFIKNVTLLKKRKRKKKS